MTPAEQARPTGLYIHVPFCDGKCPYCAFYSVPFDEVLADRYIAAVEREAERLLPLCPPGALATVYIGGGTPTALLPRQLDRLLALAGKTAGRAVREWTVEANPGSLAPAHLESMAAAGVTRVSVGVQSFHAGILRTLGRRHGPREARQACRLVSESRFARLGVDLIAGVPGQGRATWRASLDEAVRAGASHVSVYALTVDEGSALARRGGGCRLRPPSDEVQLERLHEAAARLAAHGLRRYEISNYARAGCESLHNLACWRGEAYLGLGPAASSHAGLERWTNEADVLAYCEAAEARRPAPCVRDVLSARTKAAEMVVFGLRMAEGIDLARIAAATGFGAGAAWGASLARLRDEGLVEGSGDVWRLTPKGFDLADHVAVELVP